VTGSSGSCGIRTAREVSSIPSKRCGGLSGARNAPREVGERMRVSQNAVRSILNELVRYAERPQGAEYDWGGSWVRCCYLSRGAAHGAFRRVGRMLLVLRRFLLGVGSRIPYPSLRNTTSSAMGKSVSSAIVTTHAVCSPNTV
jgi:hypothetical protein